MRTIRLDLQYDGTDYHGFSRQPNGRTIQAELEDALRETLGQVVAVVPAGRTDAGVHALGQVVSFETAAALESPEIGRALNARLPRDIVVLGVREERAGFNARRDARGRSYRYTLWRGRERNVWWRRYSYHYPGALDLAVMREASRLLLGRHDFQAFTTGWSKDWRPGRGTTRTISRADWTEDGDFLYFQIRADGFLRHMVRGIVGTLLWVGRGRLSLGAVEALLRGAPRGQAGPNAPPHGLALLHVHYEKQDLLGPVRGDNGAAPAGFGKDR